MPRGKRLSVEQQIAKKEEQIKTLQEEITALKKKQEAVSLAKLQEVVKSSGKSIDEIISILQKK